MGRKDKNEPPAAPDFLLDDSSYLIDAKRLNWPAYNDFTLEMELSGKNGMLKQIDRFRQLYPGATIEYVFDSRPGTVPLLIRNGLEEAGVIVSTYP